MQIYYSKVTVERPLVSEKVSINKERFDEILKRLSQYHSSLQEIVALGSSRDLEGPGVVKEVNVSAVEKQVGEVARLSKDLVAEAGRG
jgi:hypothetical protein